MKSIRGLRTNSGTAELRESASRIRVTRGVLGPALGWSLTVIAAIPAELPVVRQVELQPLIAHVRRLMDAAEFVGAPFNATDRQALEAAFRKTDVEEASEAIQRVLDAHCLVGVTINPESRVKLARGPAKAELVEQGWRQFLVKVNNEAGVTAELVAVSANAQAPYGGGGYGGRNELVTSSDRFYQKHGGAPTNLTPHELWLDLQSYTGQPLSKDLSGLKLEYRLLQLYSRDAGRREAKLSFNVGQGTQDLGFRNDLDILFTCLPARELTLRALFHPILEQAIQEHHLERIVSSTDDTRVWRTGKHVP